MTNCKKPGRILACIVAYDPDDWFVERVKEIRLQVDEVLVVNNFSARDMRSEHYELIQNDNVGGIAGALNKGLDYACQHSFDYIVNFDHDSYVSEGLVSTLRDGLENSDSALVGPIYTNSATGQAGRFVLDKKGIPYTSFIGDDIGVVPAYFVITSGTMIRLDRLPVELRYNERLGLDMVDVDFCLELKNRGRGVLLHTSCSMSHGIGNKPLGSTRITPPSYSLDRHSSIIKSRLYIWRKWCATFPLYVLLDLLVTAADFLRNLVFLPNKRSYLKSYWSGIIEGCRMPKS